MPLSGPLCILAQIFPPGQIFLLPLCKMHSFPPENQICLGGTFPPHFDAPQPHTKKSISRNELCHITSGDRRKSTSVYAPHKKLCTILTHHENFCRPTHLALPHQDGSSYHQSASTTPTAISSATIRPLGLVWFAVIFEVKLDFYHAILLHDGCYRLLRWDKQERWI